MNQEQLITTVFNLLDVVEQRLKLNYNKPLNITIVPKNTLTTATDTINMLQADSKVKFDYISNKLVLLAEFLAMIATDYIINGKIVIKWYQYPALISKLLKFIKKVIA